MLPYEFSCTYIHLLDAHTHLTLLLLFMYTIHTHGVPNKEYYTSHVDNIAPSQQACQVPFRMPPGVIMNINVLIKKCYSLQSYNRFEIALHLVCMKFFAFLQLFIRTSFTMCMIYYYIFYYICSIYVYLSLLYLSFLWLSLQQSAVKAPMSQDISSFPFFFMWYSI